MDSLGLFVTAAMLFMFIACAITPIAALMLAGAWNSRVMHAWWSIRDVEVGPWSGFGRRAAAFVVELCFQLLGAGLGCALGWLILTICIEHSAGWP